MASGPILEHSWELAPKEAIALQNRFRERVETVDRLEPVNLVAGLDVGFEDQNKTTRAAVAVLDFPALTLRESALVREPTRFPYVPGLLSFRELPALLVAFRRLQNVPQLLLCDGQGIAHPRRFGVASHIGVLLDIPAIGVAKTRLIGEHGEVPAERGGWTPLYDRGEVIGAVLRSRAGVKPIYISPGHRISIETAVNFVMACTTRYRLPETTRRAHALASARD